MNSKFGNLLRPLILLRVIGIKHHAVAVGQVNVVPDHWIQLAVTDFRMRYVEIVKSSPKVEEF